MMRESRRLLRGVPLLVTIGAHVVPDQLVTDPSRNVCEEERHLRVVPGAAVRDPALPHGAQVLAIGALRAGLSEAVVALPASQFAEQFVVGDLAASLSPCCTLTIRPTSNGCFGLVERLRRSVSYTHLTLPTSDLV